MYALYELQPSDINNRPYFKNEAFSIWWSNGYWFIGEDSLKGQALGHAFYEADEYCPHQLPQGNWNLLDENGNFYVEKHLYTSCKYLIIKSIVIKSLHNADLHGIVFEVYMTWFYFS